MTTELECGRAVPRRRYKKVHLVVDPIHNGGAVKQEILEKLPPGEKSSAKGALPDALPWRKENASSHYTLER
jgi:hypothetical protein